MSGECNICGVAGCVEDNHTKLESLISFYEGSAPTAENDKQPVLAKVYRDTADALRLLRDAVVPVDEKMRLHDELEVFDGATCKCVECNKMRPLLTALRAAGLMGEKQ